MAERLGEEVIRPRFDPQEFVGFIPQRGDQDDRHQAGLGARLEPAADRIAVQRRHHDVQEDQVRGSGGDLRQGLQPVGG
jgi:hypothetical protein